VVRGSLGCKKIIMFVCPRSLSRDRGHTNRRNKQDNMHIQETWQEMGRGAASGEHTQTVSGCGRDSKYVVDVCLIDDCFYYLKQ